MKQNNQTIDDFLTALKKQVRDCAFGDLKDDMVLHALTQGLDNDRTRRRLFETQKLTLDKAVNMCRLTEDTETEMRKMKINEEVSAVYKMKAKTRTHVTTPAIQPQGRTYSQEEHMCKKCGRKHLRDNAPHLERSVSFARRQITLQNAAERKQSEFTWLRRKRVTRTFCIYRWI